MVVPVRVRLAGAKSPQSLLAHTLDATESGARLAGIPLDFKVGEIIEVQHRRERALFRVIWVRAMEASAEKQMGIECVEPDKNIWGMDFAQRADEYEEQEL
jgi:hypothetical protein